MSKPLTPELKEYIYSTCAHVEIISNYVHIISHLSFDAKPSYEAIRRSTPGFISTLTGGAHNY